MIRFILPVLIFISPAVFAQNFKIQFDLKPAAGKEIKLAYYYTGNVFLKDSVLLDEKGAGTLKGDTLLPQGLYKIYLDENHHFDFLMGADQEFTLYNDTFEPENLRITGATETEEFARYVVFLKGLQKRSVEIREKIKTAPEEEKKRLQEEMAGFTPALQNYWKETEQKYPGTFLAKFLMSNLVPELDITTLPEEIQKNDSLLLLARFNYQLEHFWDHFDYTDERFLYTPLLKPKLETWFTKVLYQNYDSVKPYVFRFIEDVKPNKRLFQFVTSWFLNSAVNSNIMGMDALMVDLARAYYLSGEAFWASEKTMENIRENVMFAENNLIGKTAPDLNLESVDGEFFRLHQVKAKITVLLIFEPDCSHCKVFVPEFHKEVYQKFKNKGLAVYAIYSMDNKNEWTEFLTRHDLYDWINVWDENHLSRFKILYDARKTPGVYVLDENKKIVAKNMTTEQLQHFMERELH